MTPYVTVADALDIAGEFEARDLALSGAAPCDVVAAVRDGRVANIVSDIYANARSAEVVNKAMRSLVDYLADLLAILDGDSTREQRERVEIAAPGEDDAPHDWDPREEAEDRIHALAVTATTRFAIVLATGGPDERLIVECDGGGVEGGSEDRAASLEIRRILFRYSWTGSAEVELTGEDREVAERFALQVIPELQE